MAPPESRLSWGLRAGVGADLRIGARQVLPFLEVSVVGDVGVSLGKERRVWLSALSAVTWTPRIEEAGFDLGPLLEYRTASGLTIGVSGGGALRGGGARALTTQLWGGLALGPRFMIRGSFSPSTLLVVQVRQPLNPAGPPEIVIRIEMGGGLIALITSWVGNQLARGIMAND